MKQIIISLTITAAIFLFTFALMSAGEKKTEVRVFVSDKAFIIKAYIETWAKYGYRVESITPQSVSLATGIHTYNEKTGDIILVMTK